MLFRVITWVNNTQRTHLGNPLLCIYGKNAFEKYVWSEYIFPHTSVKTAHLLCFNTPVAPVGIHHITVLYLGQTRSSLHFADILAVQFNKHFVVICIGLFYLHWLTAPLAWTSCMLHIRGQQITSREYCRSGHIDWVCFTTVMGTIVQYVCYLNQWLSASTSFKDFKTTSHFLNTCLPPQSTGLAATGCGLITASRWLWGPRSHLFAGYWKLFPKGKKCPGHEVTNEWCCTSLLTHAWERTSYYSAQGRHITLDTLVSYDGVVWDVMPCSLIDVPRFEDETTPFIMLGSSTLMMYASDSFWHVGTHLSDHMVSHHRRQQASNLISNMSHNVSLDYN